MKIPKLPVNVTDVLKNNKEFMSERSKPIKVEIFVDPTAPRDLVKLVRDRFVPQTQAGKLRVEVYGDSQMPSVDPTADIALILAGETSATSVLVDQITSHEGISAVVLTTLGVDPAKLHDVLGGVDPRLLLIGTDGQDALDLLVKRLSDSANKDRLALAANFPIFRKAVATDLIKSAAFQNGVVGTVVIIPGADMPVMTLNQIRMVMQMAAAYNRPMDKERFAEIGLVIGQAFGWRALARNVAGLVPGLGWAIKGATGYSGTIALGKAAIEYFERDLDIYESVEGLVESVRPKKTDSAARLEDVRTQAGETQTS